MPRVRRMLAVLPLAALLAVATTGCMGGGSEPAESKEPTAANPQPYPGMEEARGRGTLRVPRDGGGNAPDDTGK